MTVPARVPYVDLARQHTALLPELLAAAREVLASGQFILGEPVREFEARFAEHCGVAHAVAVNSGTDALELALEALGIKSGDEVITVPNSFIATTTAIVRCGARPVFVDVTGDYNLDVSQLAGAINERTRALLPVHLTGAPANMPVIMEIAAEHKLSVVEDCAQAVGAEIDARRVGSFGDLGCFSLHPLKTLSACGDAGIIVTNKRALYEKLIVNRNLGLADRDTVVSWGHNSRLDTLQAALLLVKFNHLDEWTRRRQLNAATYRELLQDVNQLVLPQAASRSTCVYHTFVIQADRRDALRRFLVDRGVETSVHYPIPTHLQPIASEYGGVSGDFPIAETQAKRILSLPIYPELTRDEIQFVADSIRTFYAHDSAGGEN